MREHLRESSDILAGTRVKPGIRDRRASRAFTLMEMLVVIGMLAVLMGSAVSGLGQARKQARVAKANAEVRELLNAWLSYEAAYDDWPVAVSGDNIDAMEGAIKELLGDNETRTVYLNAPIINGAFRDPWGTPYRFRILERTDTAGAREEFAAAITFPNRNRPVRE